MASETARSGGIGFLGLLTILFIGLKLTGYIKWSWIWILAPVWGPIGLLLLIAAVCLILAAIFEWELRR